jgi:transaldolase
MTSGIATLSNMQRTARLGTDFWNDSCALDELAEAVREGAVGATSNPVIVGQAVEADRDRWFPVLDRLVEEMPSATEVEVAWALIARVAQAAAALLEPVFRETGGRKGYLSVQVNPQLYRDAVRMVAHAEDLAALAPNVAVKIPATAPGVEAMEELTRRGVRINATVCFSVSQAIACAEAVERGVASRRKAGGSVDTLLPTVTIMVGRIDDHLQRLAAKDAISIEPGHLHWAGIAVFKQAWRVFRDRGFRATLLAAAYRHHLHWTELVGENVIETIPYAWWRRFNASGIRPSRRIEEPVRPEVVAALRSFTDFGRAHDERGLLPSEFAHYGASIHTLDQFLDGYAKLLRLVRTRMLGQSANAASASASVA